MQPAVEFKFVPVEEFTWEREYEDGSTVLVGTYYVGNSYNCTKEPRHDALRDKCKEWEQQGLIIKVPLLPNQAFKTVPAGGDA